MGQETLNEIQGAGQQVDEPLEEIVIKLPSSDEKRLKSLSSGWANKSSGGYEIATVDFARVRLPFLIAAWILFASLAKIGEWRE